LFSSFLHFLPRHDDSVRLNAITAAIAKQNAEITCISDDEATATETPAAAMVPATDKRKAADVTGSSAQMPVKKIRRAPSASESRLAPSQATAGPSQDMDLSTFLQNQHLQKFEEGKLHFTFTSLA
jgi:hypothetical protein